MANYIEIYRKDPNNIGDFYANPLRYFANKDDIVTSIDIAEPHLSCWDDQTPMIFGGGGLIANEIFGENIKSIIESDDHTSLDNMWENRWHLRNQNNAKLHADFTNKMQELIADVRRKMHKNSGKKVIWGAGHNQRGFGDTVKYPKWLQDFDLVGVRDFNVGFEWVPCASCMHPAFNKKYDIQHEVLWFEHKKQLIKGADFGSDPVFRIVNSGQNFDQTIAILGSAKTIVTNSYHGVYWATLLGKKVICVDPWSSKFNSFKHPPTFAKGKDWAEKIEDAKSYPNALEECRQANIQFWERVKR